MNEGKSNLALERCSNISIYKRTLAFEALGGNSNRLISKLPLNFGKAFDLDDLPWGLPLKSTSRSKQSEPSNAL